MDSQQKPNIVWLVQDHVTWKHIRDTKGPKPRLAAYDRIASEGTVFNRAYSVIPLCTPARASMLSGVYPHKHGITRNDGRSLRQSFPDGMKLFHEFVKAQDYRTGYFGKWHAGTGDAQQFGFEGFSLPGYGNPYTSQAYDDYLKRFSLPDPLVDLEWVAGTEPVKGINMKDVERFAGVNPNGFRPASSGYFKAPVEATEAFFLTQLASDWLEEAAVEGSPFMLRVDLWGPHQPYLVADPFKDTIRAGDIPEYPNFCNTFTDRPEYHQRDREEWRARTGFTKWSEWQPILARAYEHFAQTDAALLQILDTLDKTGLADNTIVIYTADHGDILASGGGLFDKDAMLTEETMSVPLVVKWPGVTKGGENCNELVMNLDIVPTVLEMSGAEVPAYMDGLSLTGLLTGEQQGEWREALMTEHYGHKDYDNIQRVLYCQHYKYVAHLDDTDELYDLQADSFELTNRINDPAMHDKLVEMKRKLYESMERHEDRLDSSLRLIEQKHLHVPNIIK
ncbi:MAG: arylsulfatase family protein [Paenibacillus sp.]|jgi:arylsulfatase A-like enzyme|nr:arylsulfatase family protein [Paenibacillus sp.]